MASNLASNNDPSLVNVPPGKASPFRAPRMSMSSAPTGVVATPAPDTEDEEEGPTTIVAYESDLLDEIRKVSQGDNQHGDARRRALRTLLNEARSRPGTEADLAGPRGARLAVSHVEPAPVNETGLARRVIMGLSLVAGMVVGAMFLFS